jgi:hypothetical protein
VIIDDDLVILDAAADSYLCLPACASDVDLEPGGRLIRIGAIELAADFQAAGLLVDWTPAELRQRAMRPTRSAVTSVHADVLWRDAFEIAGAVWDVLRQYRGRSFAEILTSRARARPADPAEPSSDLLDLVHRFHRWSPYAPLSGKCLLRSFVLLGYLRRRGHDAQWVFGVSTWPFRAHCWLQCGGTVLDDSVERVRAFEPILVV